MRMERTGWRGATMAFGGAILLGSMAMQTSAWTGELTGLQEGEPPAVAEVTRDSAQEALRFQLDMDPSQIEPFFKRMQRAARDWRVTIELADETGKDGSPVKVILVRGTSDDLPGARGQAAVFVKQVLAYEHDGANSLRNRELSRITIQFPGGTVGEFVEAISVQPKLPKPIFASSYVSNLRMRPVELNGLDIRNALRLLSKLPPTNFEGVPVPLSATFLGAENASSDPGDALPLLQRSTLIIGPENYAPASQAPTRRAAFWLGRDAVGEDALKVLFDAIKVAVDFDEESKTFKAKYHEASRLLIVRGTFDELGVVGQVVKAQFPTARVELPAFEPASEPKSLESLLQSKGLSPGASPRN